MGKISIGHVNHAMQSVQPAMDLLITIASAVIQEFSTTIDAIPPAQIFLILILGVLIHVIQANTPTLPIVSAKHAIQAVPLALTQAPLLHVLDAMKVSIFNLEYAELLVTQALIRTLILESVVPAMPLAKPARDRAI